MHGLEIGGLLRDVFLLLLPVIGPNRQQWQGTAAIGLTRDW